MALATAAHRAAVLFGGRTFSPLDIPGCVLWLAADRISGLADGDPVTSWPDGSVTGAAAAGGASPFYKVAIMNGKPVVRFTRASSHYLTNAGFAAANGLAGQTVFAVASYSSTTVLQYLLALNGEKPSFGQVGSSIQYFLTSPSTYASVAFTSTVKNIHVQVFDGSLVGNDRMLGYLNGALLSLAYTGAQPATLGSAAGYDLGRGAYGAANYLGGDIAEVIMYNRALSAGDRRKVEAYLGTKYGISVV